MKILKFTGILIWICCFFSTSYTYGQGNPATADTSQSAFEFIKDDFIAASLDSLAGLKYFEGFECPTDETLKTSLALPRDLSRFMQILFITTVLEN
jgi:hypothetical protein